jgi:hypothetical protein
MCGAAAVVRRRYVFVVVFVNGVLRGFDVTSFYLRIFL